MDFIVLTERNDWEGEAWLFYMPADTNEGLLEVLTSIKDPAYSVEIEQIASTEEVNEWHSDTTYMNQHNLVPDPVDVPALKEAINAYNEDPDSDDPLYKGGLLKLFKKAA